MDPELAKPRPEEPTLAGRNVDDMSFLLSSRRTRLSFQRTRMSTDRTLMSIIRTALSLIGFGFTLFQFLRYLRQSAGAAEAIRVQAARNFGVTLVGLGIVLLILGILAHIRFMLELRHEHRQLVDEHFIPADRLPYSVTLAIALLLLVVGCLAALSMVVRVGPFQ